MIKSIIPIVRSNTKGSYYEAARMYMADCYFRKDKKGLDLIRGEFETYYGPVIIEPNNSYTVTITVKRSGHQLIIEEADLI